MTTPQKKGAAVTSFSKRQRKKQFGNESLSLIGDKHRKSKKLLIGHFQDAKSEALYRAATVQMSRYSFY